MVKRLFIATLVAVSPLYALAQGLITGHIKDARSGEALIGASVIVKSENGKGVVTDIDGNFSLQTQKEAPLTLRVEYVGYRPLDVDVYDFEEPVEITLIDNSSRLDEVVVVGYGTQKRLELTSSISSVSKDLLSQSLGSVECPARSRGRSQHLSQLRSAWCHQQHPHQGRQQYHRRQ